ncbi:MAG: tetratricopeptide repeat protein [Bacteroidetes bacterium]|nr:tetratricopeptide repeat protein [Bacteroidota bacterium]
MIGFIVSAAANNLEQGEAIDSLARLIKNVKQDTIKLRLLYLMSNECAEEDILKYAKPGLELADAILNSSEKLSANAKKNVLKHKALCICNIGFAFQENDDYENALAYYIKSLKIQEEIGDKHDIALSLNNLGAAWQSQGNLKKALDYYKKSVAIQEEIGDKEGKANSLGNLGLIYQDLGDPSRSLECYFESLKLEEEIGEKTGMAITLNCIGGIYNNLGDILKAIDYFSRSIKIHEELGDKNGLAQSFGNIGSVYLSQNDITKALEFFTKALKLNESIDRKEGIIVCLNNIGAAYSRQKNMQKALEYYSRSLELAKKLGRIADVTLLLNNVGNIHEKQKDYTAALVMYYKGASLAKKTGDKKALAQSLTNISSIYFMQAMVPNTETIKPFGKKAKYTLSYAYADTAFIIAKELGYPANILKAERILAKVDSANGNFKEAFYHLKQCIMYHDSIENENTRKASVKNQLKYEFEKKEAVIKEQQEKERALATEKDRFQKIVIWSVAIGLLLVVIFAGFILRTLRITKHQKIIIEEKQKEILDSIYYARRIQKSLLPTEKYIAKNLK